MAMGYASLSRLSGRSDLRRRSVAVYKWQIAGTIFGGCCVKTHSSPQCCRRRRKAVPVGPDWLHEAKLDGFRAQIHVEDGEAILYSRNGVDLTKREPGRQ